MIFIDLLMLVAWIFVLFEAIHYITGRWIWFWQPYQIGMKIEPKIKKILHEDGYDLVGVRVTSAKNREGVFKAYIEVDDRNKPEHKRDILTEEIWRNKYNYFGELSYNMKTTEYFISFGNYEKRGFLEDD